MKFSEGKELVVIAKNKSCKSGYWVGSHKNILGFKKKNYAQNNRESVKPASCTSDIKYPP